MKNLAVIPARGGSKGLPGKNKKILNGKPLIAYSIRAAILSNKFDKIIVSTDDLEIAAISKEYGADIPYMRPAELSGDNISSDTVINHALDYFSSIGEQFDYVCKLQPTSPLRNEDDIVEAFERIRNTEFKAVVSVCECEHSPLWAGILPPNLCMKNFMEDYLKSANRQTLPIYYRLNGAIYLSEVNEFKNRGSFLGEKTVAYIMPRERSIDIDDNLDFKFAKMIMEEHERESH